MKYALLVIEKEGSEPIHSFMESLRNVDQVVDAYVVYGRFDIVAFIQGNNDAELKLKVSEISQHKGVKCIETYLNAN